MTRRECIALFGAVAVAWPVLVRAQRSHPIIGRLGVAPPGVTPQIGAIEAAFGRGRAEAGYIEGKNVIVERRWASGRYDLLPALAEELLHLKPALIVTAGNVASLVAKRATSTIPIIFNVASDPVKLGLVDSFAHPGGNATGIATLTAPLTAKRLELIRELIPPGSIVGFLVNPDNEDVLPDIEDAAHATRQTIQVAKARDGGDAERAFEQFSNAHVSAVVVSNDAVFFAQRAQLIALAARHALPAIYEFHEFPAAGGLMSYGPSLPGMLQQLGAYAARILGGAQPSELPVQQPTRFDLVINAATAQSLGLTIPPSLLARADEVIE